MATIVSAKPVVLVAAVVRLVVAKSWKRPRKSVFVAMVVAATKLMFPVLKIMTTVI